MNLSQWLKTLVEWIKTLLVPSVRRKQAAAVVEQMSSGDGLVEAKRYDRNTPGAVHTWYIRHQESPAQLLITLDNLAGMRIEMAKQRTKQQKALPADDPYAVLLNPVNWKDKLNRTHRISVQWIVKLQSRNVISRVGTWDMDLQGKSADPNAKAEVVIRMLVREILELKSLGGSPWRSRVGTFPWEETIEQYSRVVIGAGHNLNIKKFRIQDISR